MKKIISLFLMLLMTTTVSAQDIFTLKIDGEEVIFPDSQPYIRDYKLHIPMRSVFEKLGFEISWDAETRTAIAVKDDLKIELPIGKNAAYVNEVSMQAGTTRLENDRTLIRQYVLKNCLGYTIHWDEEKNELSALSPEYLGEKPVYSQDTIKEADSRWGNSEDYNKGYDEFHNIAEKTFLIPGINSHATPQGLTYHKDKNLFYLSAYFYGQVTNSVIFAVDAHTGAKVSEFYLYNPDGTPYCGHVGGIAVSEKDLYIADGANVYRISLSQFDNASEKADLRIEEKINLFAGNEKASANSFVYCSEGYLWTGNYHYSSSSSYNKRPFSEKYHTVIRAYKLDANEPSGFSSDYKTVNTDKYKYQYIPEFIYAVNEEGVQGLAVTENTLYTACSHINDKSGHLYAYDITGEKEPDEKIIYDDNREVPLISLEMKKAIDTIPGIEEITAVDNNLYASFESGDMRFRFTVLGPYTDSVWQIDLEKLLEN